MLVLSRKAGEELHIGKNITISVLNIQGNQVKIGIDAPVSIAIYRGEVPLSARHDAPKKH